MNVEMNVVSCLVYLIMMRRRQMAGHIKLSNSNRTKKSYRNHFLWKSTCLSSSRFFVRLTEETVSGIYCLHNYYIHHTLPNFESLQSEYIAMTVVKQIYI